MCFGIGQKPGVIDRTEAAGLLAVCRSRSQKRALSPRVSQYSNQPESQYIYNYNSLSYMFKRHPQGCPFMRLQEWESLVQIKNHVWPTSVILSTCS
jgi:hypothetical protein